MAVNAHHQLPTLYDYYTAGGINSGLSANQSHFMLNDNNITLYSGALHYFRVPPQYWRDRLRKMRAAGLNAVETYVPWNLHEPQPHQFDFGKGGSDMEPFLDIERFLKTAQEEDLFAIVRPGPYICAEWEFGGLPSWLLRDDSIKVRTSDAKYLGNVKRYFNVLLQLLATLQFTKGGPIIALQLENEYGSTEVKDTFVPDKIYLEELRNLMINNGIKELLFTSDSPTWHNDAGSLPGILQTANFNKNPEKEFNTLKQYQKNRPTMAMEFWTGWFDHWSEDHHTVNITEFKDHVERILKYPASINFYMFHGGTTWGFLNGANIPFDADQSKYQPDTTSYDYDAPLTEAGDYTDKYQVVKDLIGKYNEIKTKLPEAPEETPRQKYDNIKIEDQMSFVEAIKTSKKQNSHKIVPMELLSVNNNSGQSYGYVVYHKDNLDLKPGAILKIKNYVYDTILVLVNNKLVSPVLRHHEDLNSFGFWRLKDGTLTLSSVDQKNAKLDLIVGNLGRNNFGTLDQFRQFKGLKDSVYLDNNELNDWDITAMEFKKSWINSLTTSTAGWNSFENKATLEGPGIYKAVLNVEEPRDTFIDMSEWKMGVVMVNGFVLGRYMHIGPQQTLYLPGPLLHKGSNILVVFEHFTPAAKICFAKDPIYFTKK